MGSVDAEGPEFTPVERLILGQLTDLNKKVEDGFTSVRADIQKAVDGRVSKDVFAEYRASTEARLARLEGMWKVLQPWVSTGLALLALAHTFKIL